MLLNVLSLISDQYTVENKELFQYIDSSLDSGLGSIEQNYSALFNRYDYLFNEYRGIKKMNVELIAANRTMTFQTEQLTKEKESLQSRLQELEKYSDEAMMGMVQDWLESHDSTIDINEFATLYKVSPTRIEQILNRMVSLGYIDVKG